MSKSILLIGEPGTGKTTSLRNLDPVSTFVIQVESKELPFRSKGYTKVKDGGPPEEGNIVVADNFSKILKTMQYVSANRPDVKVLVLDDVQYFSVNEFMSRIKETGFQKYNDIAFNLWKIAKTSKDLRDDLTVILTNHIDVEDDGFGAKYSKAKTLGKLVNNIVTLEGLFTTVLMTKVDINKDNGVNYKFVTRADGTSSIKTPIGMMDGIVDENGEMGNDINIVIDAINEYYN